MIDLEKIEGVGPKTKELLEKLQIYTVEDLVNRSKTDMLKVRNLGLKSIEEVVQKLESYGLGLRDEEE